MATENPSAILPTLERLGVSAVPADVDATKVAQLWLDSFSKYIQSGDIDGVLSLFSPDAWWRDMLALTWAFRTFHTAPKIRKLLEDRLPAVLPTGFALTDAVFEHPFPDLAWVLAHFSFDTKTGRCSGIARLVPTADGGWTGFTFYTNLEDLRDFPEKIGALRNHLPNHGKWLAQREREREFSDGDPVVLIVGGGQSGLNVAARLKLLDIPTLIVEKNKRIGDQWRNRYQALCLHDPVWYDHLPYIPFPASWPVYTPAHKLANWLESYAEALELNVWTSSAVQNAAQDGNNEWNVTVERADGSTRVLHVRHIVFAIGLGGNNPFVPEIAGREEFEGQVLHSTAHNSAKDHEGKKVFIVGSATSAHDIAADYVEHGVDVTIYQRDSTYIMTTKNGMPGMLGHLWWEGGVPTDVADRIDASMPTWITEEISKRHTARIAEVDKELLQNLNKIGFRTHLGPDGCGFLAMAKRRGGGYYLDVGASQLLIDGKIKLKSGTPIKRFTKSGFEFEDAPSCFTGRRCLVVGEGKRGSVAGETNTDMHWEGETRGKRRESEVESEGRTRGRRGEDGGKRRVLGAHSGMVDSEARRDSPGSSRIGIQARNVQYTRNIFVNLNASLPVGRIEPVHSHRVLTVCLSGAQRSNALAFSFARRRRSHLLGRCIPKSA